MNWALKYLDVELNFSASDRSPLAKYRAGTIHHRLATLLHNSFRTKVESTPSIVQRRTNHRLHLNHLRHAHQSTLLLFEGWVEGNESLSAMKVDLPGKIVFSYEDVLLNRWERGTFERFKEDFLAWHRFSTIDSNSRRGKLSKWNWTKRFRTAWESRSPPTSSGPAEFSLTKICKCQGRTTSPLSYWNLPRSMIV